MLEEEQGLHPVMDFRGNAGLQLFGQPAEGFLQAALPLDGPVDGLHLSVEP